MKFDANLGPIELGEAGEVAKTAEEMGFDGVWMAEMNSTPFMACALAAEHTSNVDVGTGIALAFPRSPTLVAYTAWSLQSYSGGRFILGLGTQVKGHIERRFSASWESPGPKLRDYVLSLRAIWESWQEGESLDYKGDFYQLDLMPPAFTPEPIENPNIPVYISAVNDYNLRTAGEICDGVHIHPFHSPKYISERVIPRVKEGAEKAGRSLSDVSLTTSVFAVTGRNEEEVEAIREFVRSQLAFYGSTRTYRDVFGIHGWGEVCDKLHELSTEGRWKEMPKLVTDEMVEVYSVEAPYDELRDRIEKRYDHLDRASIYLPFRGEDFWKEILKGK